MKEILIELLGFALPKIYTKEAKENILKQFIEKSKSLEEYISELKNKKEKLLKEAEGFRMFQYERTCLISKAASIQDFIFELENINKL